MQEYFNKVKPYLRDEIINLQKSGTWKVHLTIAINFVSSKDVDEESVMHSENSDTKFKTFDNVNDIVDDFSSHFFQRYQNNLETLMRATDFIFHSVRLMYYKCPPDWIKNKKAIINPKNKKDKCFEYTATVALYHDEIESHPERISNIKLFMNKYMEKEINYSPKIGDWERFEKNNPVIALNIFYIKETEICPAYT